MSWICIIHICVAVFIQSMVVQHFTPFQEILRYDDNMLPISVWQMKKVKIQWGIFCCCCCCW